MRRLIPLALLLNLSALAAEEPPPSPESLLREARLLGDDDAQARAEAERRLLRAGVRFPEAVLEALKAIPGGDPEAEAGAVRIALRIGNPRWRAGLAMAGDNAEMQALVDALFQAPSNDSIFLFRKRAKELGLPSERQAFVISHLLQDPSTPLPPHPRASDIPLPVRAAAAQVLGEMEAADQAREVARLLEDDDAVVRRAAVWALGEMGAWEEEPQLARRLRDESHDVRHDAAIVLGHVLRSRRRAAEIAGLLDDAERPVREAAAGALLEIANERWVNGPGLVEQARRWWDRHRDEPAFAPE